MPQEYDDIIIGGGTAGCLLANRLSEDPRHTVCLIEAGPRDLHPFIHLPAGFIKTLFNPALTWQFKTQASAGTSGRQIGTTQGRVLGGSSSINGFVYNRGQAADYDAWRDLGNPGWGYQDVLPYFRKTEKRIGGAQSTYHGLDGDLPVTDLAWKHPLCQAFVDAAHECGIPHNADYNGEQQAGVGYYQRTIHRGLRSSSARSFLAKARRRPNLHVITNAQVTRILLDGNRATGVTFTRADGTGDTVRARNEVVVSAGTLNSPKLLQLSGIGPADVLAAAGVPLQHELPGVGLNLRDHWAVRVVARVRRLRTINSMVTGLPLMGQALRFAMGRPSVLSLSPSLAHVFWKTDPASDIPDLQMTFTPASYKEGVPGLLDSFDGMTVGVWQQRPESTGYVRIQSKDAFAYPEIQPNYLAAERDQKALVAGIRLARQFLESKPLQPYFDGHISPGTDLQTDDELLDFARSMGSTVYHLVGSCRMGPAHDATSVVDHELRVHGIERLRVIDASIMPGMPSSNTMAPTYMIAEKGADAMIRARQRA